MLAGSPKRAKSVCLFVCLSVLELIPFSEGGKSILTEMHPLNVFSCYKL